MTRTTTRYEKQEQYQKEAERLFERMINEEFKKLTGQDLIGATAAKTEKEFIEKLSKVKFG